VSGGGIDHTQPKKLYIFWEGLKDILGAGPLNPSVTCTNAL